MTNLGIEDTDTADLGIGPFSYIRKLHDLVETVVNKVCNHEGSS